MTLFKNKRFVKKENFNAKNFKNHKKWSELATIEKTWFILSNPIITIKDIYLRFDDMIFYFKMRCAVQKVHLSCKLWDLRGLEICKEHGFHAQNWINGKCRKCKK
jgi:hypothetical protein